MPKIEIDTCNQTPTYCALEAIAKAIRGNYTQRKQKDYQHENVIQVESGRVLKVIETRADILAENQCDCKYRVEKA